MPKKGEAWIVCRFKGEPGKKKEGGVFEGGWYSDAHYVSWPNWRGKEGLS